jgi:DNA polymerase-1
MKYISLDIETNGLKMDGGIIWMVSIHRGKKKELIHDCQGIAKLRPDIKKEMEDASIGKIIHNGAFDAPFIEYILGCKVRNIWDTQVAEVIIQGQYVRNGKKNLSEFEEKQLRKHSVKLLYTIPRYGFPMPDKSTVENFIGLQRVITFTNDEIDYAVTDTKYLGAIRDMQEMILQRDGLLEVALLENKVTERLADMRVRGIGLDKKLWKRIADTNEKEFERRMNLLPKGINWNSPAQVKAMLLDRGVVLNSFDDMWDVYLESKNKLLGNFIYARELHKAVTSYGNNWFQEGFIDSDDRVRCHVTQCINTGRMSMNTPNLQQLPGEEMKSPKKRRVLNLIAGGVFQWKHREAFIPAPGKVFVSGDFSGQEIGIMASASNEKLWIDAMLRGDDIHSLTASLVNRQAWEAGKAKGCTFPKKCKCPEHLKLREPAKINNFMLAYGGGADNLAASIGYDLISKIDARMFVGAHKRVIPALTRYLEANGANAIKTGVSYSADPYKRRRVLRGEEEWQIRNQGKNNPIQSAGANMLKLAMISLDEKWPIVLVIHDQIILEVPKAQAPKAQKELKAVMEKSADYITGIKGLIKVNPTIQLNISKN